MTDAGQVSDWELLKACTSEDASAYSELVRKHYRASLVFCEQILGDRQIAEDMVQKGFVNIFQARHRYENRARFKTLLFRVLLNLCLSEINRRSGTLAMSDLDSEGEDRPGTVLQDRESPDPERALESKEFSDMLRRGLMQLPPKHRAALYLREYEQLSYAEIATALDATLGEVKKWIHRGRNDLQGILVPYLDRGQRIP